MEYDREHNIPIDLRVYEYESSNSRGLGWKSMTYVNIQDPVQATQMETAKTYDLTVGTFSRQLFRRDG